MLFHTYVRSLYSGRAGVMLDADKGGGAGGSNPEKGEGKDKGDDKKDGKDGADDHNSPELDELLKDPVFKAKYEAKLQEQLGKRMKKFDGVDVDKYKEYLKKEEEAKDKDLTEAQRLQKQIAQYEAERSTFETKERNIAVKEYAIENGLDSKLIARLIDSSSIKRAEGGDSFTGIEEAVAKVKEEFPLLFPADDSGDDDKDTQSNRFKVPPQKGNPDKKKDPREAGRLRALARHGKQEN